MIQRSVLITGPETEPITVAELKTHIRISHTDEDTYLTELIKTVREEFELLTGLALITQTWKVYLDKFPTYTSNIWWSGTKQIPVNYFDGYGSITLKRPPLQSITHIKTYDNNDESTTFASSNYQVSTYASSYLQKGAITLRDGASWPTFERNRDGIEIQFISGFGDNASDVPGPIRHALKSQCAYLYEHRGEDISGHAQVFLDAIRNYSELIK